MPFTALPRRPPAPAPAPAAPPPPLPAAASPAPGWPRRLAVLPSPLRPPMAPPPVAAAACKDATSWMSGALVYDLTAWCTIQQLYLRVAEEEGGGGAAEGADAHGRGSDTLRRCCGDALGRGTAWHRTRYEREREVRKVGKGARGGFYRALKKRLRALKKGLSPAPCAAFAASLAARAACASSCWRASAATLARAVSVQCSASNLRVCHGGRGLYK